jgi:hypothetical protein
VAVPKVGIKRRNEATTARKSLIGKWSFIEGENSKTEEGRKFKGQRLYSRSKKSQERLR